MNRLRSGVLILAAQCSLVASCGLTTRNDGPRDPPADAGTDPIPDAGQDVDPLDPCIERPPITEPAENCAYPLAALAEAPELASVASLQQPNCVYRLGDPIELPFLGGRYAFSFDVNGDRVGDVFFWTEDWTDGAPVLDKGLGLAVSRVENGELFYDLATCDALQALVFPMSKGFVRDLNGDGAPDIVMGVRHWDGILYVPDVDGDLRAWVNLPSGFVEVFRHDWPEEFSKTIVLDVAVADLDENGACLADIAWGYNRVYSQSPMLERPIGSEIGALASLMEDDGPSMQRPWVGTSPNLEDRPPTVELQGVPVVPTGQLAVGTHQGKPVLWVGVHQIAQRLGLLLRWQDDEVSEQLIQLPPGEGDYTNMGPFHAWIAPLWDIETALILVYGGHIKELVVYDLDDVGGGVVSSNTLLGGRPVLVPTEGLDSGFAGAFLDVDGDGDGDFVEFGTYGYPSGLAVHRNENGGFADGIEFEVSPNADSTAEHPFIRVGDAEAAFIVNNASGEDGSGPPTVQPIECAP